MVLNIGDICTITVDGLLIVALFAIYLMYSYISKLDNKENKKKTRKIADVLARLSDFFSGLGL